VGNNKLLQFYVFNRIIISLIFIIGGITWGMLDSFTFAWIFITAGVIMLLAHFLLGPIRLLQKAVEGGDMALAQKVVASIQYPGLLIKPVRSVFYMIQSNMAVSNKDFNLAEDLIKKSTSLGMPMKDMDSMAIFQHGAIAFQKADYKTAIPKLREALQKGMPDGDSIASANLMLCSIFIQRKDNKTAKQHFKKAKDAKPKQPEILGQIKDIEKYIHRLPG
jgi:tetratricopeptide (TPR) repeat protein